MATVLAYDPQTGVLRSQITNGTQPTDASPVGHTTWDANGQNPVTVPLTASETSILAAQDTANTTAANQATIQQQAQTALTNNRTYLANGSPTNAQVVAQVRALTQQMNGVIRLVLQQFDGTN